MIRAVLDTNLVLAAHKSKTHRSPNRDVLNRWLDGQFTWLISHDIVAEYTEKLLGKGKPPEIVETFITELILLAETVDIRFFHFRHYPVDSDDTVFLLCAVNGAASHLVSYDRHILDIGLFYSEFTTCKPMEFLNELRAFHPSES